MIQRLCLGILSSLILIDPALAQEIVCTPGKPTHCVVSVERGQVAPMAGQLMSHEMALSLGLKLEFETKELERQLEETKALMAIAVQKEKDIRISNDKHCKEREKILREQIDRPFQEHPIFVALVTAAAVLGCTYIATQFD